jgi:MFS family permease
MSTSQTEKSITESDIVRVRIPAARQRTERPTSYHDVFAVAEFRTVFLADLCSMLGDQIAAVAVAILLYQSSGSPLLAALGYATTYVPWLLGGPLLAAWAERFAGRSVMVGCDLARALLIALAAVPGLPLAVVGLLVLTAALLAPPFESARSALLPVILEGDRYPVAMSIRDAVHQSTQLVGFAVGGALVLAVSAPGALVLDAITFAGSALLLRLGLRLRPPLRDRSEDAGRSTGGAGDDGADRSERLDRAGAGPGLVNRRTIDLDTGTVEVLPELVLVPDPDPAPEPVRTPSLWQETLAGLIAVRSDPRMYGPLLLGIVGAAYAIVPEAIAPSYAAALGHGPSAVGLIMAAVAAGSVAGGLALGRLVAPSARIRLMYPLALVGAFPLMLVALHPGLVLSLGLFAVTGLASSYQIAANAMFAQNVPAQLRTRAFGIAISGLYGAQAAAIVLAGLAAQFIAPSRVVAGAGLIGTLGVLLLARSRPAVQRPRGRHRER